MLLKAAEEIHAAGRLAGATPLSRGLFDLQRYTRILKALFAQMAKRHRDGLPPDHLFA